MSPLDELRQALATLDRESAAATAGPWEFGDRQSVAGVMPDLHGEGKCAYCHYGEPSWAGKRSINGTRMLAHVHTRPEPWWDHGIFAWREDGSVLVVNDTDEYGYMTKPDATLIVNAVALYRGVVRDIIADAVAAGPELAYAHGAALRLARAINT